MPSGPSWLAASVPENCPLNPERNHNDHRYGRPDRRHLTRGCRAADRARASRRRDAAAVLCIVEVALSDQGEQTLLKLTHSVPLELAGSTAGALYVGPGWDGALLGIALYLAGQASGDPVAAANSRAVQDFNVSSIKEWSAAIGASGTADADAISAAQQASLAQYAPDLPPPG